MLTAKESMKLIDKTITIKDSRTGASYITRISDVKEGWGKVRIRTFGGETWFEPTHKELSTVK